MKKLISRVCCLCCVVLVLAACLPLSAFAVDPVSAGVIANAFAQAIAAYGASNGVAMTFDVASTDGIGESVHELWKDFRAGTQNADDYATLAQAIFPELYYKTSVALGTASDVYAVGVHISDTYAETLDDFYNWLLSGPAEMVQVDNQYYQFSQAQIGDNSTPIIVGSLSTAPFTSLPLCPNGLSSDAIYANSSPAYRIAYSQTDYYDFAYSIRNQGNGSSASLYMAGVYDGNSRTLYVATTSSDCTINRAEKSRSGSYNVYTSSLTSRSGSYYYVSSYFPSSPTITYYCPTFSSPSAFWSALDALVSNPSAFSDTVGVQSYDTSGIAEFPDTADPNYDALNRAKDIPLNFPWDDATYGDGTGTLTDAQSGAIAAGVDTVIAQDGVLDLVESDEITDEPGTDDPPSTDPDDYAVPGLAEIFPFCIPFDIYNFLSALSAQPVAPHFTATLDFPEAVGGTQTIDIDFDSPTWNQLAQLLRLLELLAFIIGLALLTRSMFLRG